MQKKESTLSGKYFGVMAIVAMIFLVFYPMKASASNEYHQGDVEVINKIIQENGLEGYEENAPESWDFVSWSEEGQRRITMLEVVDRQLNGHMDVSGLTNLEILVCVNTELKSLDASGLPKLRGVLCFNNELERLDISDSLNLIMLICSNNELESLDISDLSNLMLIESSFNKLKRLDISSLPNVAVVKMDGNPIQQFITEDEIVVTIAQESKTVIDGSRIDWNAILDTLLEEGGVDAFYDAILNSKGYNINTKIITIRVLPEYISTFEKWEISPTVTLTEGTLTDTTISFVVTEDVTVTPIFSEAKTQVGDIDGDGVINIMDMMAVRNYIFGMRTLSAEELLVADVNGDSTVDIFDIMRIREHIFGINIIL